MFYNRDFYMLDAIMSLAFLHCLNKKSIGLENGDRVILPSAFWLEGTASTLFLFL